MVHVAAAGGGSLFLMAERELRPSHVPCMRAMCVMCDVCDTADDVSALCVRAVVFVCGVSQR
eukprot:scaffold28481_cov129-Isochrysis_galbana.AAC.6